MQVASMACQALAGVAAGGEEAPPWGKGFGRQVLRQGAKLAELLSHQNGQRRTMQTQVHNDCCDKASDANVSA